MDINEPLKKAAVMAKVSFRGLFCMCGGKHNYHKKVIFGENYDRLMILISYNNMRLKTVYNYFRNR